MFPIFATRIVKVTKLIDIANELNISPSTVSKGLNDKGRMSPELREKIKDTAEKMQYHPNEFARSLKTNSTTMIGVILPDISNIFYGKMLKGINYTARQHGYSVIFCDSGENLDHEKSYYEFLNEKNVCGKIIATAGINRIYDNSPVGENIVFVDGMPSKDIRHSFISIDNYEAARELTEYVLSKGYREINMICGPSVDTITKDRVRGFIDVMKSHGLTDSYKVFECEHSYDGGKKTVQEILNGYKPEAIITENNFLAYGALSAIRANGLSVPDDIAVACFDGLDDFDTMFIDLTAVNQPIEQIGRKAAEIVIARNEDPVSCADHTRVLLDYTLYKGNSI